MNSANHLIITALAVLFLGFIFYHLFGFSLLSLNLMQLLITVYIFSNLPDIDNSNSKITKTFYILYLIMALFGIYLILIGLSLGYILITAGIFLFIVHYLSSDPTRRHRRFPHSFTFGLISSIILFTMTSLEIAAIGFFCFFMHLALDNEIERALSRDLKYINKILRIN